MPAGDPARVAERDRARPTRTQPQREPRGRRPYDTAAPCPIARSLRPRLTAPSTRCAPSPSGSSRCASACASSSARRASSCTAIGGNGGGYAASDLNAPQSELVGPRRRCARVRRAARGAGRARQGPRLGLLDFPSSRDGRRGAALLARRRGRGRVLARARRGLRGPETDRLGANRTPMSEFWQRVADRRRRDRARVARREARRLADLAAATSRPEPRRATACCAARSSSAIVFVGVMSALLVIPQVRAIAGGVLASSAVHRPRDRLREPAHDRQRRRRDPDRVHPAAAARRRGRGRRASRGVVEEIGLTYTWIRTRDNDRLVVPNEKLASETIRNSTIRSPQTLAEVTVQVPRERRPARRWSSRCRATATRCT